ncbi:hypothetical protein [Hymenobacter sp. BT491]|uniref:hypothetical protein n=1 Tax=Hymenobacter sp. BT491 TaxID=2766779 RepID=UPI00165372DA|nr:hypothetical protein [Hymenobacter sp. BT491]MBC6992288.1 hypothetical protein [Hymenobacter sp. BT491]
METTSINAFEKARTGLWVSLQKHLSAVYEAETSCMNAVAFAETFPFSTATVDAAILEEYWKQRDTMRDLYSDETAQLDTLVKAIRVKGYSEEEKKQLHLLILGYMDIAASVFELLSTHVPVKLPKDDELEETAAKFERIKRFVRLNIKGLPSLLISFPT